MIYNNPKAYFRNDYSDAMTADEVIIAEQPRAIDTGLFDSFGKPIYRYPLKEPIGF